MRRHIIILITCSILLCATLLSCGNPQPEATVPQVTINITEIIDKESRQPLDNNTITLRWETPDGKLIDTEQYEGRSSLTTILPANGSLRLFVTVEVPGYKTWGNAMRMNWANDRPVYITVEMELEEGLQG